MTIHSASTYLDMEVKLGLQVSFLLVLDSDNLQEAYL